MKNKREFESSVRRAVSFVKFAGDQARMRALIAAVGIEFENNTSDDALIKKLGAAGLHGKVFAVIDARGARVAETFVLIETTTGDVIAVTELLSLEEILETYYCRN